MDSYFAAYLTSWYWDLISFNEVVELDKEGEDLIFSRFEEWFNNA